MVFGITSSGFDLDGEAVVGKNTEKLIGVTRNKIEKIISDKYFGKVVQTVPLYSAVKHKGQRLYKLARKGKASRVILPRRDVELIKFSVVGFCQGKPSKSSDLEKALGSFPKLKITLRVSKGYYVRSFVNDLGNEFGVGAVTTKLVRTKVGPYMLKDAVAFKEDIQASEDQ